MYNLKDTFYVRYYIYIVYISRQCNHQLFSNFIFLLNLIFFNTRLNTELTGKIKTQLRKFSVPLFIEWDDLFTTVPMKTCPIIFLFFCLKIDNIILITQVYLSK